MKTTAAQKKARSKFRAAVKIAKADKSAAKWQTKVKKAYKKV